MALAMLFDASSSDELVYKHGALIERLGDHSTDASRFVVHALLENNEGCPRFTEMRASSLVGVKDGKNAQDFGASQIFCSPVNELDFALPLAMQRWWSLKQAQEYVPSLPLSEAQVIAEKAIDTLVSRGKLGEWHETRLCFEYTSVVRTRDRMDFEVARGGFLFHDNSESLFKASQTKSKVIVYTKHESFAKAIEAF